jgi:gamma-glutamyltranspeptidase
MGQESLNFNFEEPKKYQPRTVSIRKRLEESDISQARSIEARAQKEKYDFLENVPDWEEKLKQYQLNELLLQKAEKKKLFFYDGMQAAAEARDINDEYGPGSATYVDSVDPIGRRGFSLIIDRPLKSEFNDILDINGSILPSKNEQRLAS